MGMLRTAIREVNGNRLALDAARLRAIERETFRDRAAQWRRKAHAALAEAEAAEGRRHFGLRDGWLKAAVAAEAMAARLEACAGSGSDGNG